METALKYCSTPLDTSETKIHLIKNLKYLKNIYHGKLQFYGDNIRYLRFFKCVPLTKWKQFQFMQVYNCIIFLIKMSLAKEVTLFNDLSSGFTQSINQFNQIYVLNNQLTIIHHQVSCYKLYYQYCITTATSWLLILHYMQYIHFRILKTA